MPIIHVDMIEGRTREAKRAFAQAVTQAAIEHLDVKKEQVRVILSEMKKENYCIAGEMVADRK